MPKLDEFLDQVYGYLSRAVLSMLPLMILFFVALSVLLALLALHRRRSARRKND